MEAIYQFIKTTAKVAAKPFLAIGRWINHKVVNLRNVHRQHAECPGARNGTTTMETRHVAINDGDLAGDAGLNADNPNGTDDGRDLCDDTPHESAITQQLKNLESSTSLAFCESLSKLAQTLPRGEIQEVLYSANQDLANGCLTKERLLHYQLSIMLSGQIKDKHKVSLMSAFHKQPEGDSPKEDSDSKWTKEYHADMHSLTSTISKEKVRKENKKRLCDKKICSVDELSTHFENLVKKQDRESEYDISLTTVHTFMDQLSSSAQGNKTKLSQDRRSWLVKESRRIQDGLLEISKLRLPQLFMYGITDGCIIPKDLEVEALSQQNWEETLESASNYAGLGRDSQFETDRSRGDYELVSVNATTSSTSSFKMGSTPLTADEFAEFVGDNVSAGALAGIATQTFAAYMIQLDTARWNQISPWLVFNQSNKPGTTQKFTITKKENGDFSVKFEMKSDVPACISGNTIMWLEGAEYKLSSETTFDGKKLKQGILSADKPVIRVAYPVTESIQWINTLDQ